MAQSVKAGRFRSPRIIRGNSKYPCATTDSVQLAAPRGV